MGKTCFSVRDGPGRARKAEPKQKQKLNRIHKWEKSKEITRKFFYKRKDKENYIPNSPTPTRSQGKLSPNKIASLGWGWGILQKVTPLPAQKVDDLVLRHLRDASKPKPPEGVHNQSGVRASSSLLV